MKFKIIVEDITTKNFLIEESKYLLNYLDEFGRTLNIDKAGHLMSLCLMPNIIQVQGFNENTNGNDIKIVVDSKKTKKKILKQSDFIHWKCEGLDINQCATLAHLYLRDGKEEDYKDIFKVNEKIVFFKNIK